MRDTYANMKWEHPLTFSPMSHAAESSSMSRATFTYDTEVWINLIARDDDDCVELQISAVSLDAETGQVFNEQISPHQWSFETPSCGSDSPSNGRPEDQWHVTAVTPADRQKLYDLNPEIAADYRQVKRTFRWPMQVRRPSSEWDGISNYSDVVALCDRTPVACTKVDCSTGSAAAASSHCAAAGSDGFVYVLNTAASTLGSCDLAVMEEARQAGRTWWLQCPNARDLPGVDVEQTQYESSALEWNTGSLDARPEHSYVCFVASDGHLQSPLKCVHIHLVPKGKPRWMDDRSWGQECLGKEEMPNWAAGDTPVNNTEFWVAPGSTLQVELSAYQDAPGAMTIKQTRGKPLKEINGQHADVEWIPIDRVFDTSATSEPGQGAVTWGTGQSKLSSFHSGDPLAHDVAFVTGSDPVRSLLRFTPYGGSECSYKLCFQAFSQDGAQAMWQHADGETDMNCDEETAIPDERCFTIHVADQAAKLEGSTIQAVATDRFTQALLQTDGHQLCNDLATPYGGNMYAAWFFPTMDSCGVPAAILRTVYEDNQGSEQSSLSVTTQKSCYTGKYMVQVTAQQVSGGEAVLSTSASMDANEWHHIRVALSNEVGQADTDIAIFLDARLTPAAELRVSGGIHVASNQPTPPLTAALLIGSGPFSGYLADVAAYNSTISSDEFDAFVDYDHLPAAQAQHLIGYWRLSDGVRNPDAEPGIGNALLQAPLLANPGAGTPANLAYLQYPWWDRWQGGEPLASGHNSQASYQHSINKYSAAISDGLSTASADEQSLSDIGTALMSVRTAAREMKVTNVEQHSVHEASGVPDIVTTVLGESSGVPTGSITYDFVATPTSGACPQVVFPDTLLSHTPDECTAVLATHERAFAPGPWTACKIGDSQVAGVSLREDIDSSQPWASALKCCVTEPHPVQRPAIEVTNHNSMGSSPLLPAGAFSDVGLAVSFLEMALVLNHQSFAQESPVLGVRVVDGSGNQFNSITAGSALNNPFAGPTEAFPLAKQSEVYADANMPGQQYVRMNGVLGTLSTSETGFSLEGWLYYMPEFLSEGAAQVPTATWVAGWTSVQACWTGDNAPEVDATGAATGLINGAALYVQDDYSLVFVTRSSESVQSVTSTVAIQPGTWQHVLVSVDANLNGTVYLDGAVVMDIQLLGAPEAAHEPATASQHGSLGLGGIRWSGVSPSVPQAIDGISFQSFRHFTGVPSSTRLVLVLVCAFASHVLTQAVTQVCWTTGLCGAGRLARKHWTNVCCSRAELPVSTVVPGTHWSVRTILERAWLQGGNSTTKGVQWLTARRWTPTMLQCTAS